MPIAGPAPGKLYYLRPLLLLYCLLTGSGISLALPLVYKVDTRSGLPSNYIYNATADHLGYLWLTSPAGVIRYNGYEARVFGSNEGLPCEDIWYLLEDRSQRIWLSSISNETGYLKNGRYYPAIQDSGHFYHPSRIKRDKDGILILFNPKENDPPRWTYYTYTGNETRHSSCAVRGVDRLLVNDSLRMLAIMDHTKICTVVSHNDQLLFKPWYTLKTGGGPANYDLFNNHLCYYYNGENRFYISEGPGNTRHINLSGDSNRREMIITAYSNEGLYYVYSQQAVYVYDDTFRLLERISFQDLTGHEQQQNQQSYIYRRLPLWGATLCSTDKGVYISTDKSSPFRLRTDLDLAGYQQAGSLKDSTSYWWNSKSGKIKALRGLIPMGTWTLPYPKDSYRYHHEYLHRYLAGHPSFSISQTPLTVIREGKTYLSNDFKAAIGISRDTFFTLAYHKLFRYCNGAPVTLLNTYCTGMSYDHKRHGLWLYNEQQITFYDISTNVSRSISPTVLRSLGLRKITALMSDTLYGNIFIKDNECLYLLDDSLLQLKQVFPQYRYKNALMSVYGNRLVVAGRFGMLHALIEGKGRLGPAVAYENPGDGLYHDLSGLHITGSTALVLTDNGTYEVDFRPGAGIPEDRYRIIATVKDTAWQLKAGDTLLLRPDARYLSLDLIRPGGAGQFRYQYRLTDTGEAWQTLAGKDWNLEGLNAGTLHRIYIRANDDVWQSPATMLYVSIRPWWWQSPIFTTVALLALISLGMLIAVVTRKLVLRQQLRRQLLLEMNLNAVHAQINPHFIFNSLTTTQYLVKSGKTQEATRHISRFSRLLRSFLKASRDKYISVEEEISHLENYIRLEQERFSFGYTISVDPDLNTSRKIPSLLLQPLVENAIQHGLLHKKDKGHLLIVFETVPSGMLIRIEDDGIGREAAKQYRETSRESYGKDLLSRLVQLFNTYEPVKLDVRYIDKVLPESGTVVMIHINDTKP